MCTPGWPREGHWWAQGPQQEALLGGSNTHGQWLLHMEVPNGVRPEGHLVQSDVSLGGGWGTDQRAWRMSGATSRHEGVGIGSRHPYVCHECVHVDRVTAGLCPHWVLSRAGQ